ncbi:MAG: hypothetical protein Roseis2KO_33990 [Roseivirga sp.]
MHLHSFTILSAVRSVITLTLCLITSLNCLGQANFKEVAQSLEVDAVQGYGAAIIDYDNDGLNDLFITARNTLLRLYKNMGDGTFTNTTFRAGLRFTGEYYQSCWADINNDGHLDLYLGKSGNQKNQLFLNDGDGTFTNISASAGVDHPGKTVANMFSDVDGDGFVDLYLAIPHAPNVLYRNNGDLTFTDITAASGAVDELIAMGAGFFDYDNDGDPDLYLVHDTDQANILYENDGTGKFTDVSVSSGTNYAGQGMGVDFGDFNNDGFQDIYITNMWANVLYKNNGDGTFEDVTTQAGVGDEGMGWGITWFDHNNDGWEDIFVTNDAIFLEPENVLYENQKDGTFSIVSESSVLAGEKASYSVAAGDLDNDGDIDLWVGNPSSSFRSELFINELETGNYITLRLAGTESNQSAIGARVQVDLGDHVMIKEVRSGTGYAQHNSLEVHFGLAEAQIINKVTVTWPSGTVQEFGNVLPNARYGLKEGGELSPVEIITPIVTSTENEAFDSQVSIYPNPARDKLMLDLNSLASKVEHVRITNLTGSTELSLDKAEIAGRAEISLDLSKINPGLKLIRFTFKDGRQITRKLFISR